MNLVPDHSEFSDDLEALLRGELSPSRHAAVIAHLDTCGDCRFELVASASSHGALTAARRILGGTGGTIAPESPQLPPLTLPKQTRRANTWRVAAVAAGAVSLTSLGLYAGIHHDAGATTVHVAARSAVLEPLAGSGTGSSSGTGKVTMLSTTPAATVMTIDTSKLRAVGPGQFYYAWLLDPTTNKMLPLGVIDPDGTATFTVATVIIGRYQAIDVSLEADDGNPGHSDTSVLRASY